MSPTKTSERKGSKNVRNVNTIRCFCARVGPQLRSSRTVGTAGSMTDNLDRRPSMSREYRGAR